MPPDIELIKGETIYTVLRHVSRTGMTRWISVFAIRGGDLVNITRYVSEVTHFKYDDRRDALRVHGAGMDVGFHVVYELSYQLYDSGYELLHRWI